MLKGEAWSDTNLIPVYGLPRSIEMPERVDKTEAFSQHCGFHRGCRSGLLFERFDGGRL